MHVQEAVERNTEGVLVRLRVIPGASKAGFGGYDRWRKCIRVSLRSQPLKGEANTELVALVSEWFGVERSSVDIVSGMKERSKTILVRGTDKKRVVDALAEMEEI